MKTGLLIALGVAVAVALGWMGTRKKEEPQPAPEPKPEPKPEPVAEPAPQAAAPSEKPTLVMSPEEAQQAATESMASTEPTVTPEEPTQEPASAEEAPAELEAATEGALADDSGDEVELESTADEDPSEAETVLAPVEVPAATENPAGGQRGRVPPRRRRRRPLGAQPSDPKRRTASRQRTWRQLARRLHGGGHLQRSERFGRGGHRRPRHHPRSTRRRRR